MSGWCFGIGVKSFGVGVGFWCRGGGLLSGCWVFGIGVQFFGSGWCFGVVVECFAVGVVCFW